MNRYTSADLAWLGYNPDDIEPSYDAPDVIEDEFPQQSRQDTLGRHSRAVEAMRGHITKAGGSYETSSEQLRDHARAAAERSRVVGDHFGETGFYSNGVRHQNQRHDGTTRWSSIDFSDDWMR